MGGKGLCTRLPRPNTRYTALEGPIVIESDDASKSACEAAQAHLAGGASAGCDRGAGAEACAPEHHTHDAQNKGPKCMGLQRRPWR